jgi:DNA-binding NarL/FixJ family response regulator
MSPIPSIIKVAIIEDLKKIRDALVSLIDGTEGFRCTANFESMEEALVHIGADLPHVALVDIGLPGMSGVEGIRALKKRFPELALVMLTVYADDKRIFDAICAGACGYLLKKTPPARLLECVKEAMDGGAPMSPEVARRVLDLFREYRPPDQVNYDLTPHDIRVLKLLVDGHHYQSAAGELGVSINTVRFHLRGIYEKLQVHSKSQAVAKVLRDRILH